MLKINRNIKKDNTFSSQYKKHIQNVCKSFILFLGFISLSIFNSVSAQFSGGDGSVSTPYIITTAEQLAQLATYVNEGVTNHSSKHYKLGNDINLSAYQSGDGWTPIGISGYCFLGVFDGNNKKILGLKINITTDKNVGLFSQICESSSVIKNLGIVDAEINVSYTGAGVGSVGIITGACNNNGSIENCYSTGQINFEGYNSAVGGIVGMGRGYISNCYSTSSVNSSGTGSSHAGGIVGNFYGEIKNCYSTGSISSAASANNSAGGIIGYSQKLEVSDGVSNCAALNSSINNQNNNFGRVIGITFGGPLISNNIAFNKMLNPNGNIEWNNKGEDKIDGEDISIQSIMADGTLGGRFTSSNGWTTQNGKLPGLFGNTVDIPVHFFIYSTDTVESCESYTWIDGNTYTEDNNTATHIFTDVGDNDSIVTLNLTIHHNTTGTDIIESCEPITWIDGNTYSANNNTATHALVNSVGCDSLVTLDLTIINPVLNPALTINGNTLTSLEENATYQWVDCDNNNTPIVGATEQSYTSTVSGSYAVILTSTICENTTLTSDCEFISTSNVEYYTSPSFVIYPNPTESTLSIENDANIERIELYDLNGKLLQQNSVNNTSTTLNIGKLNKGIYLIKIIDGKNITVSKIVKK